MAIPILQERQRLREGWSVPIRCPFDAGYKGDYETRPQRSTERGAWLLIGRCLEAHKMDERDPTEYEIEGCRIR